jgi:hypothetical protein
MTDFESSLTQRIDDLENYVLESAIDTDQRNEELFSSLSDQIAGSEVKAEEKLEKHRKELLERYKIELKEQAEKQEWFFTGVLLVVTLGFLGIITTMLVWALPLWLESTIDNKINNLSKVYSLPIAPK